MNTELKGKPMPLKQSFTDRLKQLRGDMDVTDLARQRGVSPPTIYKAEGGERNVKWQTIEAIYGEFCNTTEELTDLLILWALTQSASGTTLLHAQNSLKAAVEEIQKVTSTQADLMRREMEGMEANDQRELVEFARRFRQSEATREMARAWMKAVKGMG